MLGQMMNMPLMISSLIRHADDYHGDAEIVSRLPEGSMHRYTYRDAHRRSRQLANALRALGIKMGDRIGTLAWNTHRHFEIYFGVSGIGAICHTINPRLFPEQISYIANHAGRLHFLRHHFYCIDRGAVPHCPKSGLGAVRSRQFMNR